jgi:hypothetical protein
LISTLPAIAAVAGAAVPIMTTAQSSAGVLPPRNDGLSERTIIDFGVLRLKDKSLPAVWRAVLAA